MLDADVADAIRSRVCSRPFKTPSGQYVRCQSRRVTTCPSCARLYRGDWERIARSGIYDADGRPVSGYRFYFITLSAPSFGAVHRVPKPWDRRVRACGCGVTHSADDVGLRGLPIDLGGYDYRGQVAWHGALGRLWASSVQSMRRIAPDLAFFAVREAQARLALHIHVVVRVPEHQAVGAQALGGAARRATTTHPATGELVSWGQRGVEDREIRPSLRTRESDDVAPDMSRAAARVIGYVAKALGYSLKDLNPGSVDEEPSPDRIAFVQRLRHAARFQVRCVDCPPSGPADCTRSAHDNLGFGGHVVTASRPSKRVTFKKRWRPLSGEPGRRRAKRIRRPARPGWSLDRLTRTRLREERRRWMAATLGDDLGGGLDETQVAFAMWLQDLAARRARERWSQQQEARAP